jgi:plastocyanin
VRRTMVAAVMVAALAAASCSSGGGGSSGPSAGGSGAGCTTASATDLTGQNPFTITIKGLAYHPSCFSAKNNSTITITNQDNVNHTFTVIGTGVDVLIPAGQSVTKPGANLAPATYQFHCTIHPQITGTVIVVAA